jgi:hypothetical protein
MGLTRGSGKGGVIVVKRWKESRSEETEVERLPAGRNQSPGSRSPTEWV